MAENPKLIDQNCPVRPCVIEKGLDNCSQCENYVCDRLRQRVVEYAEIAQRVGPNISQEDYQCFIRPYENKRRLDALKAKEQYSWPPAILGTDDPEEILSQLVHEFKHPINAIKGYIHLILQGMPSREAAEEILKIATNMEIVQNAVFDYLRARGRKV